MSPIHEKWLRTIERDRKDLWDSLASLTQDQFTRQPKSGKWSISEIVSHLMTAEKLSLEYMKKKSLAIESLGDSGWFDEIKMVFFIASQRIPVKYSAPKAVVKNTPRSTELATLSKEWSSIMLAYREFLGGIPAKYARRKIYKHPFLGRLDAKHCLQSINEHYHHHLPQIKRLL